MVLDDLLDLLLDLGSDLSCGNLFEEWALSGSQVLTELSLPAGDLVNRYAVELYEKLDV